MSDHLGDGSAEDRRLIAARSLLGDPGAGPAVMNHELMVGLADKAGYLLGRGVDVLCLASQQPRIISVHGLAAPMVVYTPRYVELTTACRYALLTDAGPYACQGLGLIYFSEILTGGLIRAGLADTSLRVFLTSCFGRLKPGRFANSPFMAAPRWNLEAILAEPDPVSLISTIGFGVAHEVGHFIAPDPRKRSRFTSIARQELANQLAAACANEGRQIRIPEEGQHRLLSASDTIAGSPLNPEHVVDEIWADWFAWDCLFNYIYDVCRVSGHDFDPTQIAAEIVVQMAVLYFFERAEVNCRLYATPKLSPHEYLEGAFQDIGLGVRMSLLKLLFAETMAYAHHQTDDGSARRMHAAYLDTMGEMSAYLKPRIQQFEMGVRCALDAADQGEDVEHTLSWGMALAEVALRKGEPSFKESASEFCRATARVDTPGVRRLRNCLHTSE